MNFPVNPLNDLFEVIQNRTDAAISGYVKAWKNQSIISTLSQLKDLKAIRTEEDITRLVRGSYEMEGIDNDTIHDVCKILNAYYNTEE